MPGRSSSQAVSRRVVLRTAGLGCLATAALGGCDLDLGASSSSGSSTPPPDPDEAILVAARTELQGLIVRLTATTGAGALVACHRTQLAALQGDPPPVTSRGRPLPPARLVARERRTARRFIHWATTCQNGELARVLAAVAAGISMQPAVRAS